MKNNLLLLISLFIIHILNAQEITEHIAYYDFVSAKNIKESGQIDKDGFPIGEWKYYLKNGVLEYSINHSTHFSRQYYTTGKLKNAGSFDPLTGAHIGEWISYHKNGKIKMKGTYDEDGKKNSEFIIYSENGIIESAGIYKKDVIQK